MKFLIAIDAGDANHAWGVVVPDLPGCFSAGDSYDEALVQAREAINAHCTWMAEDGEALPPAAPAERHRTDPQWEGWDWATVEVPVERHFMLPAEKLADLRTYSIEQLYASGSRFVVEYDESDAIEHFLKLHPEAERTHVEAELRTALAGHRVPAGQAK